MIQLFNSWKVHHVIKLWLYKHWCLDCILINYLLGFQQRTLCHILRRAQVSSNFIDGFCTYFWMLMKCDVHATVCRTLSNSIGGLLIAAGLCLCWGAHCQCGWIHCPACLLALHLVVLHSHLICFHAFLMGLGWESVFSWGTTGGVRFICQIVKLSEVVCSPLADRSTEAVIL